MRAMWFALGMESIANECKRQSLYIIVVLELFGEVWEAELPLRAIAAKTKTQS